MKLAILIAILTACSSCAYTSQPAGITSGVTPEMVPDRAPTMMNPAVVRLLMTDKGQCTAWKVGENLIATAGHCCESDGAYTTEGPHSVAGVAPEILVDDDDHDICIMKGQIDGPVIALAKADPRVGATLWTAGYPHGVFLISDGYWSGRDEDGDGVCSVVVNPGASGSPVMNTQGEAVGILVRYRKGMDNLSYITSLNALHKNLEAAKKLL